MTIQKFREYKINNMQEIRDIPIFNVETPNERDKNLRT